MYKQHLPDRAFGSSDDDSGFISDNDMMTYWMSTDGVTMNAINPSGVLAPGGDCESAIGTAVRLGRAKMVAKMLGWVGPSKYDWKKPNAFSPFLQLCQLNHPAKFLRMLNSLMHSACTSLSNQSSSSPSLQQHRKSASTLLMQTYLESLLSQLNYPKAFAAAWEVPDVESASAVIISHMAALEDPRMDALDLPDAPTSMTPLHLACRLKNETLGKNIIKHLLKNREQLAAKDDDGNTPMDLAAFPSYLELIRSVEFR
jgi:hypothetical protein